jgi:hypothetical protein
MEMMRTEELMEKRSWKSGAIKSRSIRSNNIRSKSIKCKSTWSRSTKTRNAKRNTKPKSTLRKNGRENASGQSERLMECHLMKMKQPPITGVVILTPPLLAILVTVLSPWPRCRLWTVLNLSLIHRVLHLT